MPQFIYRIQPIRPDMLASGPTQEGARIVAEHFSYLQGLAERGVVHLAGPARPRARRARVPGSGTVVRLSQVSHRGDRSEATMPS